MFKSIVASFFVALMIAPVSAATTWTAFTDPNGAFAIEFPGTPVPKTEQSPSSAGGTIPTLEYTVDTAHTEVLVMVGDFTNFDLDPVSGIDNAIQGMAQGHTVISTVPVTRDGHDGKFVTLTDADGLNYTDMLFVIDKHMYQIITVAEKNPAQADTDDNYHFSQTFHFLSP